jgi:MoaA/NifB/PqqE/SkfB family radical SAM enzyme
LPFYNNKIKAIHLEVTDHCNASCPQCARNKLGGAVNPNLPKKDLSLDDIKNILPADYVKNLKRLYMCGNYGDPIVAKDTLEIFQYLRNINEEMDLAMNTNASARDEKWWTSLGQTFGKKGNVKFGIDGLEDTHSIHRRKTDFNKIIKNAKAFIAAGGRARWEFIVFKHNEHQVEKARALSEELGFEKFTVKKTGRFFSNTKVKVNENQEVHKEDGSVDYLIHKPTLEKYQNKSLNKELKIIEEFGSMNDYLDQTDIKCKTVDESSLYISSEGLVFPCCWTANQMYLWYMHPESGQMWDLLRESGGKNVIDAKSDTIDNIIESEFFSALKKRWSCSSVKDGKLKVCAKTCGTLFDQFKDQY